MYFKLACCAILAIPIVVWTRYSYLISNFDKPGVWDAALDAGTCVHALDEPAGSFYCLPTAIMIGAQKCGSTAFANILLDHPQINGRTGGNAFTASRFKQDFWSRTFRTRRISWRQYLRQPAFLLREEDLHRGVITFEKSPDYMASNQAMSEIRFLMPSVKLLAILRDPVTRAYSAYQWQCRKGRVLRRQNAVELVENFWIDILPFHLPWAADCDDPSVFDQYLETAELRDYESMDSIIGKGMYAKQLRDAMQMFGSSSIFVVLLEDFSSNRTRVLRATLDFLDLEPWNPLIGDDELSDSEENRGLYRTPMSERARRVLEEAYEEPNRQLEELLAALQFPLTIKSLWVRRFQI